MCSAVLGPNDGSLAERLGRDFTDPAVPFVANADAVALLTRAWPSVRALL